MPIRAELRRFYGREWREVTRPLILARAENCCEQCGVPNYATVKRIHGYWLETGASWTLGEYRRWRTGDGGYWKPRPDDRRKNPRPTGPVRTVYIVLTIAHVNHIAGDDRDDNLRAWCQYCHLQHDLAQHAETRATRKDAARPLLQAAVKEVMSMNQTFSPPIEEQIAQLLSAGWVMVRPTLWKAPASGYFLGPHGAWLAMKRIEDRDRKRLELLPQGSI